MRVLAVTTEWPTPGAPADAAFLTRQIDAVRSAGVEIDVEHFRGATNPLNYLNARKRIRHRLGKGRYDIVHAHFGQAGLGVIPSRLPFVVTFYGSDIHGVVGASGAYTVRGFALSRLSRVVARLADEVIVISSSLGRRLPRRVRHVVIPVAVDLDVFRPGPKEEARATLGLDPHRKLILFAGKPELPVKRFELAQRTVDLLEPDVRADLVTISGLPPAGVATYMKACDALLVTSRHEGGPAVVKEALACGLPVVSVDVGDVRETIGDVPGCLVENDRPEALSEALAKVLTHPARIDVRRISAVLDQSKQAARIIEVYERLVRRSARPNARPR